jgi:uroporphyrinogen decarboxylase
VTSLSHRQRVLLTFQHQAVDRLPMDLMGNATMLLDQTYLRLRDHLGLSPIPPVRSGSTANYYDERILEIFDIDFRRIFLPRNPSWQKTVYPDGSYLDEFGVRNQSSGAYVNFVDHPLKDAASVKEIESYPWPSAGDLFTTQGLAEQARRLFEETDYALVARNPITFGFLDRSCAMMGIAEFMMTLALNPLLAQALIAHLLDVFMAIYALFLDAVGPYVHMVEYGDDLGAQSNPLISPKMFEQFIAPAERQLFALIRQKAPQAAIFHHTDGSIFPLIPALIDAGVDVLNPVQTSSQGMDGRRLKETFGEKLTFHGAIEKMDGPVDALVGEVQEKIAIFAPEGGYVFAPCNHMIDVPPENILAMFETAHKFGRYGSHRV